MQFPSLEHVSSSISSKTKLIGIVIGFRCLFWLAMAISCYLIPDHNPGDDVLRFNMRLDGDCFNGEGECETSSPSLSKHFWKFWLAPLTKWDAARFLNLALDPSLRDPPASCTSTINDCKDCSFASSEQAHAFFPMFPLVVQQMALLLTKLTPRYLLPPTWEGVLVLSGWFVNSLSLLIGTLAMWDLTSHITTHNQQATMASCIVYGMFHPAYVFFATNYSESLFSALTLVGHVALARKQWIIVPIFIWMVGSYTRSNGTLQSLWLLQLGLAHLCLFYRSGNNEQSKGMGGLVTKICICLVGAILVAFPVKYHDWQGYRRHCQSNHDVITKPLWCPENASSLSFSLYEWTQRQHWNVGFFQYYKLKQIPNFLLAAPILGLSLMAVYQWIYGSLIVQYGKGKAPQSARMIVWNWPLSALAESLDNVTRSGASSNEDDDKWKKLLVHNPLLLGHYAILAVLTLVGFTIAHVQISTRMICSSTPSIIWFMTYCLLQQKHYPRLRQFVGIYITLFMLLGVILHVNFLPWT